MAFNSTQPTARQIDPNICIDQNLLIKAECENQSRVLFENIVEGLVLYQQIVFVELSALFDTFSHKLGNVTIQDILDNEQCSCLSLTLISIFLENQMTNNPSEFVQGVSNQIENLALALEDQYLCEFRPDDTKKSMFENMGEEEKILADELTSSQNNSISDQPTIPGWKWLPRLCFQILTTNTFFYSLFMETYNEAGQNHILPFKFLIEKCAE